MYSILVLGAGRSTTSLINYLKSNASIFNWWINVADIDFQLAKEKIADSTCAKAFALDIYNDEARRELIRANDLVISMLPPDLHILVARDCIEFSRHLFTASYLTSDIVDLQSAATEKGILFLNEMGLDPGIDHMSAMVMKKRIEDQAGQIYSFCSFTGGLISPECDTNPWHYKITWNPMNVVLAGRQTAVFREDGQLRYLPYQLLFENCRRISVLDGEEYEMYPNRDSLKYQDLYELGDVETLIRGTLRHIGFCYGWAALVRLGLTDDKLIIPAGIFKTYRALFNAFLPKGDIPLEQKINGILKMDDQLVTQQLIWLFDETPLSNVQTTMADHLRILLIQKWNLRPSDKDLVVMHHQFEYKKDEKKFRDSSTLHYQGVSSVATAMTHLVGLPLAISAKLLLTNQIKTRGVQIPVIREIYEPVLQELDALGVRFMEKTVEI